MTDYRQVWPKNEGQTTIRARDVKVGYFVVLENKPCKVTEVNHKMKLNRIYVAGVDILRPWDEYSKFFRPRKELALPTIENSEFELLGFEVPTEAWKDTKVILSDYYFGDNNFNIPIPCLPVGECGKQLVADNEEVKFIYCTIQRIVWQCIDMWLRQRGKGGIYFEEKVELLSYRSSEDGLENWIEHRNELVGGPSS